MNENEFKKLHDLLTISKAHILNQFITIQFNEPFNSDIQHNIEFLFEDLIDHYRKQVLFETKEND